MRKIMLAVIGTVFATQANAHDPGLTYSCNSLIGNWAVFCPKGTKPRECTLDDDVELDVGPGSTPDMLKPVLSETSPWEVPDGTEVECAGTDPIVAIPVKKGGQNKFLCVRRITDIRDLGRRKGQMFPNLHQVGMRLVDAADECTWSLRIDPGHSHADN